MVRCEDERVNLAETAQKIRAKLVALFHPRALQLSSPLEGTRHIFLSTRAQITLCAALMSVLTAGLVGVGHMIFTPTSAELAQQLAARDAQVAAMQADLAGLQRDVALHSARLEKRQAALAALLDPRQQDQALAALDALHSAPALSARMLGQQSQILAPLAAAEANQLLLVARATRAAQARYQQAYAILERLGLQPAHLLRQSMAGQGGPLDAADAVGGPLAKADPRFKELFLSWQRLDLLEKAMASIPSLKPVKAYIYTSGFGIRLDPFTGETALHAGVDMSGPVGEPIYAAGDGTVQSAGWNGAYGNMIDLAHGQGIETRYGHMSRVAVKPGARVRKGDLIGYMGSTGRSTGSHLHFEVRIDGRAVNPMPFLEAGAALASIASRPDLAQGGPLSEDGVAID